MKWHRMTYIERCKFCERHGFDYLPTPVQLARSDFEWLRKYGTEGIDSVGFYREPLLELGEFELWKVLEWAFNQALLDAPQGVIQ